MKSKYFISLLATVIIIFCTSCEKDDVLESDRYVHSVLTSQNDAHFIKDIVKTPIGKRNDIATSLLVQPDDGKILLVGKTGRRYAVVRYLSNGRLDTEFGNDGITIIDEYMECEIVVAILQTDNKIVIAGTNPGSLRFQIMRLNPNGALDLSFGRGNGKASFYIPNGNGNERVHSIALQEDGKILLGGVLYPPNEYYSDMVLIRVNSNGTLDYSFGDNGIVTSINGSVFSIGVQPDNKILVAGSSLVDKNRNFKLVRYLEDGSIDSEFGDKGEVIEPGGEGRSLAIQEDGKIIIAGTQYKLSNSNYHVKRFFSDGNLDDSFGNFGSITIGTAGDEYLSGEKSIVIQPDGKIVIAGTLLQYQIKGDKKADFNVARFNLKGTLDQSFGADGFISVTVGSCHSFAFSAALDIDGKILIGGYYMKDSDGSSGSVPDDADFAFVRLLSEIDK